MSPRVKSYLFNAIRFGVCALGIWYIYTQLTGQNLPKLLGQMDKGLTVGAVLLFSPVLLICSVRFAVMMAIQDIHIPYWNSIKLTYAGAFLNFAMPGATGGDLYKAYCVARGSDKKTEAVMAVFLDRVVGLASLVIVGGVMSLVGWSLDYDIGVAAKVIGGLLIAMIIGSGLFFSRRVRAVIRYDKLIDRLPLSGQLRRIDQAMFILRRQKRKVVTAFLLTALLQGVAMASLIMVAAALGMKTDSLVPYLVYLPLGMVIRAIPISIQGIGPMDGAYELFFVGGGLGTAAQAQILALAVRLLDLFWAIPGVLALLTGRELPPKDFAEDDTEDKSIEANVLDSPADVPNLP